MMSHGQDTVLKDAGTDQDDQEESLIAERKARKILTPNGFSIECCGPGDHPTVHHFLTSVFQTPSQELFYSSLEDPYYEPYDRVVAKRQGRIISHALISKREMFFDSHCYPVANISWLGTLPEYQSQGLASQVMQQAEKHMVEDGALLGTLVTRVPYFFRPHGWAVCGKHCSTHFRTREALAEMSRQETELPEEEQYWIRPWRQVELLPILDLYQRFAKKNSGSWNRSEGYLRWLVSRNPANQIWVAVDGEQGSDPDVQDLSNSKIIGYCITRNDQVFELVVDPDYPKARQQLLKRACREAIERDFHEATYHGTLFDTNHSLLQEAGGTKVLHESHQSFVSMVKVLEPVKFLQAMFPILEQRIELNKIERGTELGFVVDDQKYLLQIKPRSLSAVEGKIGRSYLCLNIAEFTRMLLGHTSIHDAINQGRIETSTRTALELSEQLFPQIETWKCPLDDGIYY